MNNMLGVVRKIVFGFLRFCYDFIVGDCWPLALGVAVVLLVAVALVRTGGGAGVVPIFTAMAVMALVVFTAGLEWWRKTYR